MRARARFQLQLQLRLLRLKIAARAEDAETLRPSGTCEGNAEEDPAAGPLDVESCSRVRCWGDVQLGGGLRNPPAFVVLHQEKDLCREMSDTHDCSWVNPSSVCGLIPILQLDLKSATFGWILAEIC